jgi:opacity protein-like surface antigen
MRLISMTANRLLLATMLIAMSAEAVSAAERDWNGFYLGGHLGYGQARVQADFAVPPASLFSTDDTLRGGLFGGQAGYNFQRGALVIGIEADAAYSTQKTDSTHVCLTPACGAVDLTFANEQEVTWLATLRGRVGYAFDRWLVYGTGGVGGGGFKSKHSVSTTLSSVTKVETNDQLAWVAGAGVEVALSAKWSLKFEYLYMALPDLKSSYTLAGVGLITETDRMDQQIVRAGLNYRF